MKTLAKIKVRKKADPSGARERRRRWVLKNPEKWREICRRRSRRANLRKHPIKNFHEKIAALVPAHISGIVREDVCQQLAVEILSGAISLKEVPAHVERVRKAQSKFLPSSYMHRFDALESWQRERLEQRVVVTR